MGRRRITGIAVLMGLCAGLVVVPSAGAVNQVSFSSVGSLSVPRDFPGIATLSDGRVMVAGGGASGPVFRNSTELFDPATNAFSAGPTMGTRRYGPTATTLLDGRVLIAGGQNGSGPLPTAEVFNPSTNSFSPVGSMTGAREEACAVLLKDGRVLVAGGFLSGGGSALDTAELFNPATNTFAPAGSMTAKRDGPACGRLPDGRVLVTGGGNPSGASAEVFDPASNSFSPISATLPDKIFAPSTAVLPGGRILIAGGFDTTISMYTTQSEVFDPVTGAFISGAAAGVGPTIGPRQDAPAATLKDGRVLFAGGFNGDLNPSALSSAEILSVPSNAFKAKLKGTRVTFKVTDEGAAMVSDTSVKVATTAKKKKKPKLVKTTKKHGGPGKIVVKVKLTKLGAATLSRKGKLKVRVSYTPDGGLAATKKLKLSARK